MEKPRDLNSQALTNAQRALANLAAASPSLTLDTDGSRAVEAWFLGPKAENAAMLERFVVEAIRDHAFWRRNYHPGDPTHITEAARHTNEYVLALDALEGGFQGLLAALKKSVPFFSPRYQGHMNWDLTIPGMLGYFAAMLYNPNNVAFEGSTATTFLELLVGDDLCRMLGYSVDKVANGTRAWGHITCDGTVANIEAIWAARNLKLYPVSIKAALLDEHNAALAAGRDLTISLPSGGVLRLVDLSAWQLLNLHADEVLAIPARLNTECRIDRQTLDEALNPFSLQTLGLAEFSRRFLAETGTPRVFVPGSKHYSFPKAVALLGLGSASLSNVAVDLDARQDLAMLRSGLDESLQRRSPVIAVVGVIGTTEESAVDPLADILALRDEYSRKGLVFHVHADAAFGGYHRSLLNDPSDMAGPFSAKLSSALPLAAPLSDHTARHLRALGGADSITVDPHKSGFIPYPAGALCYRNSAMRDLVTFSAPVVFHGDAEPTVGIYGVEGSKPGASVAAVYLSHRVIRPTREGYGKILGEAMFSCRKLYARLLSLARPDDPFVVVPVARTPAERAGRGSGEIRAERTLIHDLIDTRGSAEISADERSLALLREIGPDQNILAYAFNFRRAGGVVNEDLASANRLNKAIYGRLSIKPGTDIYGYDMIVSTTDLDESAYGAPFIAEFKRRLGVTGDGKIVTVLRSVVMNPWVTETIQGSFIDVLASELRRAVIASVSDASQRASAGY